MNISALMQVQVGGQPDEIVSISNFDFSWILEDPEDENIEDLIVLSLFRNYFALMSINHSSLPITDMNPNSTSLLFGTVEDYSTLNGHTQDSASLVCFNERTLKDFINEELQLGEEAIELPLEEFIELARPHLPPSLEVIQNPVTLRIVRATLPPPLPPLMPTALISNNSTNYIDVFNIIKEKLSNRESVVEGSHTVARYNPIEDYIEFVAECGLYFGMEETGNFQIEVESDNSRNGNANFSIELSGVKEWFDINLGNQKFFDMFTPNLDDGDYYFNLEQEESGSYRVYLAINNLSGRRLGININTDADKLLIESDWTHEEEYSGRGIIVNEIPYGISNIQFKTWNTFLAVPNYLPDTITSLERTFESCKNFDSDISNWDTSRVTSLSNTFNGCESFMQDISRWDVSNVTNMEYAFNGAYNFNSDLSRWNVGKVESFEYAFNAAPYFNSDLSQWDTSSARNMFRMFSSASRFSSIVEDWDVSNVENMDYMFQSTSGETTSLPPQDLSRWCVTKVPFQPMGFIDYGWTGILPIWGTCPSEDGDMVEMGLRADYSGTGWYKATDTGTVFNKDVPALETHVFSDSPKEYVSVHTVEEAKLYGSRAAVSNITDMREFFRRDTSFNQDLSSWDVSNVIDMVSMFDDASSFNSDLSSWDVSSVTNMDGMFYGATSFNSDISSWDVSLVTDMYCMFEGADLFNSDLSSWDVGNVTDMYGMFARAYAFNSDLSSWDVSSVTDMDDMFNGATSFNQDLSHWCVTNIPSKPDYFDYDTPAWTLPKPVWGTCPSVKDDSNSSNKISFIKFHQRLLNKDLGQEIGIHYSMNDGEIEKFSFQTVTETSPSVSQGVMGIIANNYGLGGILGYGSKVFGWETGLPEGLSGDYAFAFGADEEVIREFLESEGMEIPPDFPIIEESLKLTYYPQSAVNNSSLDFDVFSLLIDPSDYTPEDLNYFKELGIEPATKNADGSYTIHSTARIPIF